MPSMLNVFLASDVDELLDHQQLVFVDVADRALSREQASTVIHAALSAYGARRGSTAAAFAWLELLEAIGLYPFARQAPPQPGERDGAAPPPPGPDQPTAGAGTSPPVLPAGADAAVSVGGSAGATPLPQKRGLRWTNDRKAAFSLAWHRGDGVEDIGEAFGLRPTSVPATATGFGIGRSAQRRAAIEAKKSVVREAAAPGTEEAPRRVEGEIIRPGEGPPRADTVIFARAINEPTKVNLIGDVSEKVAPTKAFTPIRNRPVDKPPEAEPSRDIQLMAATEVVSDIQAYGYVIRRSAAPGLFYRIGDGEQSYTVQDLRRVLAGLRKRA